MAVRPTTVDCMSDDLRPWRAWYGISLFAGAPRAAGDRNTLVRRGRHYQPGRGFHNRRVARMHAESNRGVACGLGFAFRRAAPRR